MKEVVKWGKEVVKWPSGQVVEWKNQAKDEERSDEDLGIRDDASIDKDVTGMVGTATDNTTLLSCSDLHKHYRMGGESLHILRGVNMHVNMGEWVAVIGASGSGKSTLLHILGGLDRPDEGSVHFSGNDVFGQSSGAIDRYRNRSVGFVFQFYHLLPEFGALDNVLMNAMVSRSALGWMSERSALRERAAGLLQQMGLGERLKHRPSKLSGGERQRVAIARALINQPAVLLADEPTGNLDADTGKQILELLTSLQTQGQTIVMVTHDPQVAALANRQLRLVSGRLVNADNHG